MGGGVNIRDKDIRRDGRKGKEEIESFSLEGIGEWRERERERERERKMDR